MFTLQQPLNSFAWEKGDKPTPVITYRDVRGDRYFFIRPNSGRYDIRIVVQGQRTADQAQVSAKQVEMTARTLGISLLEDDLERLAKSTAVGLHTRASR